MPSTITELTTHPTTGNQFVSGSDFTEWTERYTGNDTSEYWMGSALLDDLDDDFLGESDVVAISFYFGIENGARILLLTGTKDSGEDAYNPDKVYYLYDTSDASTDASGAASRAEAYKSDVGGNYTTQNPGAFVFNKGYFNNLRNQAGVAVIKAVRGIDDEGNNIIILVAANSNGEILDNLTYQYLDKSRPCPPFTGCGGSTSVNRSDHQF